MLVPWNPSALVFIGGTPQSSSQEAKVHGPKAKWKTNITRHQGCLRPWPRSRATSAVVMTEAPRPSSPEHPPSHLGAPLTMHFWMISRATCQGTSYMRANQGPAFIGLVLSLG